MNLCDIKIEGLRDLFRHKNQVILWRNNSGSGFGKQGLPETCWECPMDGGSGVACAGNNIFIIYIFIYIFIKGLWGFDGDLGLQGDFLGLTFARMAI